jgi:hypothetical protein
VVSSPCWLHCWIDRLLLLPASCRGNLKA